MNIELTRDQYRKLLVLAYLGDHVINTPAEDEDEGSLELLSHLNSYCKEFDSTDLVDPTPLPEDGRFYGTRKLDEQVFKHIEEYDDDIFWNDLAGHLAMRDLEGKEFTSDEEREEFIQSRAEHYVSEFEENGLENFKLES
jgi:hypothetical protein